MSANPTWTLEGELCKVSEAAEIGTALHALRLLSHPLASFRLTTVGDRWIRGGAETYIYRFSVSEEGREPLDVLIKACVAYAPGANTLDDILQSWVERRELLASDGVIVPNLYGWGHGVIIEEYIPYGVREVLQQTGTSLRNLLDQLTIYAASLSRHGFAPISPFSDLRSHGDDIVAIDFGEDIGAPNSTSARQPKMFEILCDYLKAVGTAVPAEALGELQELYEAHGGAYFH